MGAAGPWQHPPRGVSGRHEDRAGAGPGDPPPLVVAVPGQAWETRGPPPESPMTTASEAPVITAPRGTHLHCKGWVQEAALRMLMNNLDPEVAERPEDLAVYGGRR